MRRLRMVSLAATVILFASADPSFSQDWYVSGENNCSGNAAAIAAFTALLPSSYPIRIGAGSMYTSIGGASVNALVAAEKIVDDLTLSKPAAADYKKAMGVITENYNLPYVVEVDVAILAAMAPPVVGLAGGLLFSYVVS